MDKGLFGRIRQRIEDRRIRKRNNDLCSLCTWYRQESGVCQIKKCSGRSEYDQYVTKRDRRRCDNFDRKPIGKVTPNEHRERSGMSQVMKGPLPPPVTVEPRTVEYWAENRLVESMTWNDVREAAGLPRIEEDDEIRPKRCAYCGCSTEKVTGTCEHCGAPL